MKSLLIALKIFGLFTVITGIAYPLLITGITRVTFPQKANGSMLMKDNKIVGSELIAQNFDSAIYFTGRPSATSNNPLPSGGSNLGLTNEKLRLLVEERKQQFIVFNQLDILTEVPSEMLFASASGSDPHISPQAALLQVDRVANARGFNVSQKQHLLQLVKDHGEKPQFAFLGQERVNVLLLNMELDKIE